MASKAEPFSCDLSGREVIVCVCGGIAAYKVCEVVSRLVQAGAGVTVAMTRSAQRFVGPTTFQALSGRSVLTDLWSSAHGPSVQHISLTERANLIVVAPATANVLGKIAGGIADDIVTTLVISAASPVLIAPAMNPRMWKNPAVADNLATLNSRAFAVVGPGEGWLACRSEGAGRMAEPDEILSKAEKLLTVEAKVQRERP